MLKFITALLFAQVLLAAPFPQQEDMITENNEFIGNSNVQFISAAEMAQIREDKYGIPNPHLSGGNSAPDPAQFSGNTPNTGAPPKLDSPKPQKKMGSS